MIRYAVLSFMLLGLLASGCSDDSPVSIPDFSRCGCSSFDRDIVCGEDGRTYLNACLARCVNTEIAESGSCPDATNDPGDTLRWAIQIVCIPLAKESDPQEVRILSDGSVLYKNTDGSYFRGTQNLCRCLPGSTMIATPSGAKPINSLQIGDDIRTQNLNGQEVVRVIKHITRVPVPDQHKMLQITLEDNRILSASPLHPDANGKPVIELETGDCLDGSAIIRKQLVNFEGKETWDLIPEGRSHLYYANDILIGSTLANYNL